MVFAVYCPPQAPAEGQATSFNASNSSLDISPASNLPTPSKTSTIVTSCPLCLPGKILPPYIKILGIFKRTIAIIIPGKDLSQPAIPSKAS